MSTRPSILPAGMKLVGDVAGDEDFVVFGTIEGEVQVDGAVVVEATGSIRGNVFGRTVSVRGVVVGDASARETIRVDSGARMVGDVHAPRVNIVKGARFRGRVHMSGEVPTLLAPRPQVPPRKVRASSPPRSRRTVPVPAEKPTVPGSVRALSAKDTVVDLDPPPPEVAPELGPTEGATASAPPRRPPPPRMPALRRTRARRRDSN